MNRKEAKEQIKQLKQQIHIANRASDIRLLKMVLAMVILAIVAAVVYGKIFV